MRVLKIGKVISFSRRNLKIVVSYGWVIQEEWKAGRAKSEIGLSEIRPLFSQTN